MSKIDIVNRFSKIESVIDSAQLINKIDQLRDRSSPESGVSSPAYKSTSKRFKAESSISPQLQSILRQEADKNLVKIAKISIEERPIPDVVEGPDGNSEYVFAFSYYHQPYFSIFITLENGERYFAPGIWADSVAECEKLIPSHLTVGNDVERISLPFDPWYRFFPKIAFKDTGSGELSTAFVKF